MGRRTNRQIRKDTFDHVRRMDLDKSIRVARPRAAKTIDTVHIPQFAEVVTGCCMSGKELPRNFKPCYDCPASPVGL